MIINQEFLDDNNIKMSLEEYNKILKEQGFVNILDNKRFDAFTVYTKSKFAPIKWVSYQNELITIRVLIVFGLTIYSNIIVIETPITLCN